MGDDDSVVVDTHALLWWQAGSPRISRRARTALESSARVLVSPLTCWEIAMLVAKGRVRLDRPVQRWINDLLATSSPIRLAALTSSVAVAAGSLVDFHGDPADRMIYAAAAGGGHPLVTKDGRLREYAKKQRAIRAIW